MANLFPPLFPLPPLRQPYTSSCDCPMNIRDTQEELHNSLSIVYRTVTTIRLDIVKIAVFILINGEPWLYGGGGIPFQLKSDSLPHAHAQTSKTYYKHKDSRIMKAQELKIKTSANSDIQDLPSRYQVYQGRLLASLLDDAKYKHVGQDTRSQGGKDDQDKQD
ncbi:hypothetical protein Tco_1274049 [Tanacetum coccineum]